MREYEDADELAEWYTGEMIRTRVEFLENHKHIPSREELFHYLDCSLNGRSESDFSSLVIDCPTIFPELIRRLCLDMIAEADGKLTKKEAQGGSILFRAPDSLQEDYERISEHKEADLLLLTDRVSQIRSLRLWWRAIMQSRVKDAGVAFDPLVKKHVEITLGELCQETGTDIPPSLAFRFRKEHKKELGSRNALAEELSTHIRENIATESLAEKFAHRLADAHQQERKESLLKELPALLGSLEELPSIIVSNPHLR